MDIMKAINLDEEFFETKELTELASVKSIMVDVKKHGDEAVRKYSQEFDGCAPAQFRVDESEIRKACEELDAESIEALNTAAQNIETFAQKQLEQFSDFEQEIQTGVVAKQKVVPIERVGIYTPAGKFPLPSTVLMCGIPAKVAGVKEIALFSPPTNEGRVHQTVLAAANIIGINEIYQIGGVQAVAAMTYGTETVKPVDKIVGPGGKYVTTAKKYAYGDVGIDFIAGPSELMIIADESAEPNIIAADLIAQAEHDEEAVPILLTNSMSLVEQVIREISEQLKDLDNSETALVSLNKNGKIILYDDIQQAVDIANRKAPEHIELLLEKSDEIAEELKNFGSLFIGKYSAQVLGDYSSGLNHTLPTNRSARFTGGLSVLEFLKLQTTLKVTSDGYKQVAPLAKKIAEIEGLQGHSKALNTRK